VDGGRARALAYASLTGPLRPGDRVLLNTTAVELGLGTGGAHFVIASLQPEAGENPAFPGREAGHIMKLRYTPLQFRVQSVEEEASPHHAAFLLPRRLEGTPVLVAELHSQAGAAVLAACAAAPDLRIVLVQVDTAALPLSHSRLVDRLRRNGALAATVTVGNAFGGDYEAVNIYSGLLAARSVARADIIIVTQGPGNAGTGTLYGFSGLALAEALHAADHLGGDPLLAPRLSRADPRPRHSGLSMHTIALLRCTRVPVTVPFPPGAGHLTPADRLALAPHRYLRLERAPSLRPLTPYRELLTTMGRTLEEDTIFFRAAAGAGAAAALRARREDSER